MKIVHVISFALLVIGGLNWLLVGAWDMDLVARFLGEGTTAARVVYILVGVSAVIAIFTHKGTCKDCTVSAPTQPTM